jgi:hypothetical protein
VNDEEAIRRALALLCQLRDQDRYDEWIELFAPDGTFDYGVGVFTGRDAILAHVTEHFPAYGKHLCLNSVIDIDGDEASVMSDFVKLHPLGDGTTGFEVAAAGRYDDRFARDGKAWRVRARTVLIER